MPKPPMPDGLYVSVSQLKSFLICSRRFELHYVRGITPAFVPAPLAFGAAFHEGLAAHYRELQAATEPLTLELLLDVFRTAWERERSGPVPIQGEDETDANLDQLTDRGVAMLKAFREHALARASEQLVEHVEKGFIVEITDPETGEVRDEQLVGTMDLVTREGGTRVVIEHKSAARKYSEEQLRWDFQVTAYRLACRELGLGAVGLRYQVVTKTKQPQVHVVDVHRDAQDELDFLRIVSGVLRAIDAGVSYPVRGWQCRSCPYQAPCGAR